MTGVICDVCGERVHKMDGYTSKQWDMIEEEEENEDLQSEA